MPNHDRFECQTAIDSDAILQPEALLPSLLKPFTTSKEVGLGIGLSICVSLMEQMKGELRLASTMTRNACVVLQFRLTDVEDAK